MQRFGEADGLLPPAELSYPLILSLWNQRSVWAYSRRLLDRHSGFVRLRSVRG